MRKWIDLMNEGEAERREAARRIEFGRRSTDTAPLSPENQKVVAAAEKFSEFDAPNRRLGDVKRRAGEDRRKEVDESLPADSGDDDNMDDQLEDDSLTAPEEDNREETYEDRDVALEGDETAKQAVEDALNKLSFHFEAEPREMLTNAKEQHDNVLAAMASKLIKAQYSLIKVKANWEDVLARDVLARMASEAGFDSEQQMLTHSKDGSSWLHVRLSKGGQLQAVASARDASRHRMHKDFGSYLFIAVRSGKPTE